MKWNMFKSFLIIILQIIVFANVIYVIMCNVLKIFTIICTHYLQILWYSDSPLTLLADTIKTKRKTINKITWNFIIAKTSLYLLRYVFVQYVSSILLLRYVISDSIMIFLCTYSNRISYLEKFFDMHLPILHSYSVHTYLIYLSMFTYYYYTSIC